MTIGWPDAAYTETCSFEPFSFPTPATGEVFFRANAIPALGFTTFLFRDIVTSVTGLIFSSTCFAEVFSAVVYYRIDPFVLIIYLYKTFCRKFDLEVEQ